MDGYEARRQQHLAHAMGLVPELVERLGWTADRLAAYRDERLRDLVRAACASSPWHRKRLGQVDVDTVDGSALSALPVMTKADLMEHYGEIVTDDRLDLPVLEAHLERVLDEPYLFDRYTVIASGGSTGTRGVFVYDWEGWSLLWAGLFRYLLREVTTSPVYAARPMVMASVAAGHFTHATAAFGRTFTNDRIVNHRFPVTLPVDEIVAGLNRTRPDAFFAYPSALQVLAAEARAGRLRISPSRVLAGAEPLLPEIRAAAEEAWGVKVWNWWGSSEGGPMGVACPLGSMHLCEDLLIVEPVDEYGDPVAPGETSAKIYLTNLYNPTLPLIRFEITDQVTILPDPCACGSAHRVVADIVGRLDDVFRYRGLVVNPHLFRSALGRRAEIVEYQVRQTAAGADIDVRCTGPLALGPLEAEMARDLAVLGLPDPVVTISARDQLDRAGTGKLRRFVALNP